MTDPCDHAPVTSLRRTYERARNLTLAEQVEECVDLLGHPEILVTEMLDAFCCIDDWVDTAVLPPLDETEEFGVVDLDDLANEIFYSTREIAVLKEPCGFTSFSSDVDPLRELRPAKKKGERDGFDYVGLTCDPSRTPVLGVVQSDRDTSAYPLLLRGLACLSEMAPAVQIERMNRQFFMGVLGPEPRFDLNLVVWDNWERNDRASLDPLTRDLAEQVKAAILERGRHPGILRDIVCLRMNPKRFDGRMRFDWRV
jgi:hypothetical protein